MFRLILVPFRFVFAAFGTFGPLFAITFGLLPFIAYWYIGALATGYDVQVLLHHSIPFLWALLLSLILGPVTITAAIVIKILTVAGVLTGLIL